MPCLIINSRWARKPVSPSRPTELTPRQPRQRPWARTSSPLHRLAACSAASRRNSACCRNRQDRTKVTTDEVLQAVRSSRRCRGPIQGPTHYGKCRLDMGRPASRQVTVAGNEAEAVPRWRVKRAVPAMDRHVEGRVFQLLLSRSHDSDLRSRQKSLGAARYSASFSPARTTATWTTGSASPSRPL
jgi:hypothetical protein